MFGITVKPPARTSVKAVTHTPGLLQAFVVLLMVFWPADGHRAN